MRWSGFREGIIYCLYNTAFMAFFIIGSPWLIAKVISGRYRIGLKERFGFLPGQFIDKKAKRVWIHAVSVGEVGAAMSIVVKLKEMCPGVEIFFSTTTPTGQDVARKRLRRNVFYYPVDFPWTVRRSLKYIQPDVFVAMETEIWPNMFRRLNQIEVPILLLNARISNRSFCGYKKIRPLLRNVLDKASIFGVQTEDDGNRFKILGVNERKIFITGNSKFDSADISSKKEKLGYFEYILDIDEKDVIVFGSTHPGEEEIILKICREILQRFSDIRFIICPRHPERAERVEELIKLNSFKVIRRSRIKDSLSKDIDFVILDTVGELSTIYGLATLVFIGGSLVPRGGQNIIEPAFWGKPTLFGPYMYNFKEIVRIFLERNAACQVKDSRELRDKLIFYLTHRSEAQKMGGCAKDIVLENQGASKKSVELILRFL